MQQATDYIESKDTRTPEVLLNFWMLSSLDVDMYIPSFVWSVYVHMYMNTCGHAVDMIFFLVDTWMDITMYLHKVQVNVSTH